MYLRVLCILQRGALREGIPKRSLGTRKKTEPEARVGCISEASYTKIHPIHLKIMYVIAIVVHDAIAYAPYE